MLHPPDQFPEDVIGSAMKTAPENLWAEIDKVEVKRRGLRAFIERAWPTVEGQGTYRSNWHIEAICEHLEAVSSGEVKRLMIAVPPRHMKSLSVAVMWLPWHWIQDPRKRFLFSSYAQHLALRDSVKCRRVLQSPWYQQRWGDKYKITTDQNTKVRFDNDQGGYRLSTSVGGMLTGEGGDICVIDDPINSKDTESEAKREGMLQWWKESMSTRLNDPATGAFVIIQQRLHARDLVGDIIKTHGLDEDGGEYLYLCLPAEYDPDHPHRWFRDPRTEKGQLLWPNRVPRKELDSLKASLGPYASAGQLQQLPSPREGGIFKRGWFILDDVLPPDVIYGRGWDLAASEKKSVKDDPDYTATALMAFSRSQRKWYLVDVQRWRLNPADTERVIKDTAKRDKAAGRQVKHWLPQDPGQAGKAQAQALLAMLAGYDVVIESQSGSKMVRASGLASQASGGNVRMMVADWNDMFLQEMTGFPNFGHDDMFDAAASAFNVLTGGTTGLLEYYRQKAEQAQRSGPQPVADETVVRVTHDFGAALTPGPTSRG